MVGARAGLRQAFALALLLAALLLRAEAAHALVPTYTVDATLDVERRQIAATQRVEVLNTTGVILGAIVFRSMHSADGRLRIASPNTTVDGSIIEVTLAEPLPPDGVATVELRYTLDIPTRPDRLSVAGQNVTMGSWIPLVTLHRGQWDRRQFVDVGDAFASDVATFDVSLRSSVPLIIAGPAAPPSPPSTTHRWSITNARDFALSASPAYATATAAAGDVPVTAWAYSPTRARELADAAAATLSWHRDRFGPYPFAAFSIAESDMPPAFGGLEYPGLILLARGGFGGPGDPSSPLGALIAHEVAHQWFYALVGNDQIEEPWLDEAFANYLPYLYCGDATGDPCAALRARLTAGDGVAPADSSVYDFPADGPYFAAVYRGGSRFLDDLRLAVGDEPFLDLSRRYVELAAGKNATARGFLDLVQSTAPQAQPVIARHFQYRAFHGPGVQRWHLHTTAEWRGIVITQVTADFPVERVELWLDDRHVAQRDGAGPLEVDASLIRPGDYLLLAKLWGNGGVPFERMQRVRVAP
jgi:hypothetical protein